MSYLELICEGTTNSAGKFRQGMRSKRARYLSLLLRWGMLIGIVVLTNYFISILLDVYVEEPTLQAGMVFGSTILLLLILYAVLLAIPFFPGAEVGILILTTQGSSAAPFVYLATILGLLTSYFTGLAFSSRLKSTLLKSLGLQKNRRFCGINAGFSTARTPGVITSQCAELGRKLGDKQTLYINCFAVEYSGKQYDRWRRRDPFSIRIKPLVF